MTNKIDMAQIGLRVKTLRLQKAMNQLELAGQLGVSQTHMSNLERGRTNLTLELLARLADVFGCSLDEIVFGEPRAAAPEVKPQAAGEAPAESRRGYSLDDLLKAVELLKKLE